MATASIATSEKSSSHNFGSCGIFSEKDLHGTFLIELCGCYFMQISPSNIIKHDFCVKVSSYGTQNYKPYAIHMQPMVLEYLPTKLGHRKKIVLM
jgi:hypothetical protein